MTRFSFSWAVLALVVFGYIGAAVFVRVFG